MISRRIVFGASIIATAVSSFTLGVFQQQLADRSNRASDRASYDVRFDAIRAEFVRALAGEAGTKPEGTTGAVGAHKEVDTVATARGRMISEIKEQLRGEMGLLPLSLLRERQPSFVELYTYDNHGEKNYGTAGYLGQGYFVTVKHAVVPLGDTAGHRKIKAIKVVYKGEEIAAKLIDAGQAKKEVDSGDWAIIRTADLDLPALQVDPAFAYEFATPIVRFGNDYSKGIAVSTGYVGQRTTGGLVTSLTDGHPGVSGGGVLDQRGVLVGIPIGRMQGDYRFSFILPMRTEMLRKVPAFRTAEPAAASVSRSSE